MRLQRLYPCIRIRYHNRKTSSKPWKKGNKPSWAQPEFFFFDALNLPPLYFLSAHTSSCPAPKIRRKSALGCGSSADLCRIVSVCVWGWEHWTCEHESKK